MSKLEELINQLCPDGVEYVKIGDICKLSSGGDVPKENFSKEKTEEYNIPIYSNGIGENALYGYTNIEKVKAPCVTISARGTIGYCELREENFYPIIRLVCAVPKDGLNAKFLKYCIDITKFAVPTTGIPQLTVPMVSKYSIPLPPLPVQEEIVRILDNMTSLTAELTAELKARQKQYEYYRDSLLSFEEDNAQDGVRWMKLGEVVVKTKNIRWSECEEHKHYIDLSSVDRNTSTILETTIVNRENAPSRAQQLVETDDVILGTTRPMLKRFCVIPEKYDKQVCSTGFSVLRANTHLVLPKWIYFIISTNHFYSYVESNQQGTSYPAITDKAVKSYLIPVPSLEVQQRIVDILDRFDKLCNDISEGLPAEIEARKKQYEYYRDKLLTFKEKEA